jgi:hypothetical protein
MSPPDKVKSFEHIHRAATTAALHVVASLTPGSATRRGALVGRAFEPLLVHR